jgi:hypothetical protein
LLFGRRGVGKWFGLRVLGSPFPIASPLDILLARPGDKSSRVTNNLGVAFLSLSLSQIDLVINDKYDFGSK